MESEQNQTNDWLIDLREHAAEVHEKVDVRLVGSTAWPRTIKTTQRITELTTTTLRALRRGTVLRTVGTMLVTNCITINPSIYQSIDQSRFYKVS